MATLYNIVTKETLDNKGITLKNILEHSTMCQRIMKKYNMKSYDIIIKAIEKLEIPYSSLFKYSMYSYKDKSLCIDEYGAMKMTYTKRGRKTDMQKCGKVYLADYEYASISWNSVEYILFKHYYPTLARTFVVPKEVEPTDIMKMSVSKFLSSNIECNRMSLRDFVAHSRKLNRLFKNRKTYTKYEPNYKLYSDSPQLYIYTNTPNESAIYIHYEDLLKARRGDFDGCWNDICSRGWLHSQTEEEWWNTANEVTELKTLLKEIADKAIMKRGK